MRIGDAIPIRRGGSEACVLIVRVAYGDGPPETYVIPLAGTVPHDAMDDAWFREALLEELARGSSVPGARGEIVFLPASEQLLRAVLSAGGLDTILLGAEQSNTSIAYGKRFVLKLYRAAEAGVSPEVEIGSFLTARKFAHATAVRGRVEYRPREGVAMVIAVLADHIAHEADGWKHALGALAESLGRARSLGPADLAPPEGSLLDIAGAAPPRAARDLLGEYADAARLLGKRTAELHLALASDGKDPAFAPEPFGAGARAALHGSMTGLVREVFGLLRRGLDGLPGGVREKARRVLDLEGAALERFGALLELPLASLRIRRHGDYHLGQVLWTGRDFVITDFEGEVSLSGISVRHLRSRTQSRPRGRGNRSRYRRVRGGFDPRLVAGGGTPLASARQAHPDHGRRWRKQRLSASPLEAASPAVDAGDPNQVQDEADRDIDGELRVIGGRVDIGADEFSSSLVRFVRGDCNDDGDVNLSDAVCMLDWRFGGGPAPVCIAAADSDGKDAVNITDAIHLLDHLFLGGPAPPPPYPSCGIQANDSVVPCTASARCD